VELSARAFAQFGVAAKVTGNDHHTNFPRGSAITGCAHPWDGR
jgi:hypothetical protein